jgi:hypothetical protein
MPYVNKPRPYKKEYEEYQGTPEQIKNRSERNKARAKLMKEGKLHKGDGKDAAHVKALSKGGTNKTGVKAEAAGANRSFLRGADHSLKSEVSKRERKK